MSLPRPHMLRCLPQIEKFGDSVVRDIKEAFAYFPPRDEIANAHCVTLKYGISLVECIMIRKGQKRTLDGSDFVQPHMDGSCAIVSQLHEMICDVLARPNLPSSVSMTCCTFLESHTGLLVPMATWQILRRHYHEGSIMTRSSILRIARGNDIIPDEVIAKDLMSLSVVDLGEKCSSTPSCSITSTSVT